MALLVFDANSIEGIKMLFLRYPDSKKLYKNSSGPFYYGTSTHS
jgi:hypothetical protein